MKKLQVRKFLKKAVAAALLAGMLTACGTNTPVASDVQNQAQEKSTGAESREISSGEASAKTEEAVAYPIVKDPITITIWSGMHPNAAKAVTNYNEMEFYKRMEELTNVKVEFIHPSMGQEKEGFNLMVASRELPDVVEQGWKAHYNGGQNSAFIDGYISSLNDLMQYAPNLQKFMKENPEVVRGVYNDEGDILGIGQFRPVKTATQGAIIRADWLKELNLTMPTTIAQWTETLKTIQQEKGTAATLISDATIIRNQTLSGAFGVKEGFMLDEKGAVTYGQLQPGYQEFLKTLNQWYAQGLLDPEFASNTSKTTDTKFTDGQVGIYFGWLGGGFTNYLNLYKESDPDFSIQGMPYPVLHEGDKVNFGNFYDYLMGVANVSADSEYKEAVMKYYDYAYTQAGILESNFGYEGITYDMVDGAPVLSDAVLNNPEGKTYTEIMSRYNRASSNGYSIYLDEYFRQVLSFPQQKEALDTWNQVSNSQVLPENLNFNAEETTVIAEKMSEINTYSDEMLVAFIMGKESLENYTAFQEQLKKMGIEDVIAVYQAAYDRYSKV